MLDSPFLWLVLVAIVAASGSIHAFLDNYIADVLFNKNRPEAFKVSATISFAILIILLLIFAPPVALPILMILGFLVSGILDSLGTAPYLRAFKYEEATGITVLRQLSSIFALVFGFLFLQERIDALQIVAFALILLAAFIIIRSRGKRHLKIEIRATRLVVLAILGWVSSEVIFLAIARASGAPFLTAFFWFAVGKWLGDLGLTVAFKSWRTRFLSAFRKHKSRFVTAATIAETLRIASNFIWRQAMLIAPTLAIAAVTETTLKLFLTFGFGLALSILWPKFGRETMSRKVILMHLVAVVIAAVGVFLVQI